MRQTETAFPHITSEIIESGIRRGRVQRSQAVLSLIDAIFGKRHGKTPPSEG